MTGDSRLFAFASGLRQLRREAGNPPYRRLAEQAHYSISTLSSAASGQRLPTLAVTLAYVRACGGNVDEWRKRWQEAAELLGELSPESGPGVEGGLVPPYTGLRAFREQDAAWFFGRERLLEELVGRLERQRFVVVIGASGSGKSSLLRAGLVPRLEAAASTTVIVLTPGAQPLEECAVRLGAMAGLSPGALYRELREDPRNLGRVMRQVTARSSSTDGDSELVLVVDQFEESFTLCQDMAERDLFIKALVSAASDAGVRCRVALGVRADFYAHCTRYAPLVEAIRDAQVPVGPMSLDELRRAVVQPAQRAGLTVEGALLATLIAQARGQVGVLPLLSHALLQTWRRRRGNALTLDAFEAAGGLEGALARTAEDFYQELDAGRQKLARQVFVRLTALGDGTEDTRRPARPEELAGLAGSGEGNDDGDGEVRVVLEMAAGARLLTLDRERVELAHEVLIRCWPRLHGWLTEDRDATRTARHLTDATQTWEALGREPGALYRGTRLALAAALDRTTMSAPEREFLDAGLAAQTAEHTAMRRRAQFRRLGLGLLSVLLVLTTTTTVLAVRAQRAADRQRDIAGSQRVAERAVALRTVDPALAAQLSLAAYRLSPTPEARGSVLGSFATPYATQLTGQQGAVTAVAFSTDGRVLVSGDADGAVRLRQVPDPHRPAEPVALGRVGGTVRTVAVSPDGRLLAAGGEDGTVTVWDIGDTRRPRLAARLPGSAGPVVGVGFGFGAALAAGSGGHTLAVAARDGIRVWGLSDPRRPHGLATLDAGTDVTAVAFRQDGRTLSTGHADGAMRLWELVMSGERLRRLSTVPGQTREADGPGGTGKADRNGGTDRTGPISHSDRVGHTGQVNAMAFAPDGLQLVTGGADFTVRLWDVTQPRRPRHRQTLAAHTDAVNAVAFSPEGRQLATAGTDATVRRWNVSRSGSVREAAVLSGHTGSVGSLAFGPGGRTLASGSEDQSTRLWDLPGPALTGHTSSLCSLAFSPDGRLLASASYDRTVRLWNLADPRRPRELPPLIGHTGPVQSVVFSHDGRTLASAGADGTLRLWALGAADGSRARPVEAVPARIGAVNTLAFSPDGRTLATGGEQGTVRLWDAADARRPRPLSALHATGAVDSVAFAPDGRTLAVARRDGTAALWDVTGRRHPSRLTVLTGHTGAVKSVAFAPDGRTLATGSEDRTVRVWNITDPRHPLSRDRLTGYTDGVMSVAFAPNGLTLAAASSDKKVRLYGLTARGEVREPVLLTAHTKPVDTLAFSPDGRTLATGSQDWTVLLWDPDAERTATRICATVFPTITRAEWSQYFPQWKYRPPCGS